MEIKWDKVFKIEELADWFLVYQNTLSAVIIHKKDFSSAELEEFISIITAIPNVPVHLKNK